MVTSITMVEREIIERVNRENLRQDSDLYGFIIQGREYQKAGLDRRSAKYPEDTYVGSFRYLGWVLEAANFPKNREYEYPDGFDIGWTLYLKEFGEQQMVLAYGDGFVLVAPLSNKYKLSVVRFSGAESVEPRK
ncbi:hypothetical protein VCHA53O466_140195 [Vibrio chagasii]|nr:hypothetical protein VCHA53O466_140195 [Vibrio chagasii]